MHRLFFEKRSACVGIPDGWQFINDFRVIKEFQLQGMISGDLYSQGSKTRCAQTIEP
jgi:hypothetical protein